MPKIRIREKDLTQVSEQYSSSNAVFIVSGSDNVPTKVTTSDDKVIKSILDLGGEVFCCSTYANASQYLKDRNQYDIKFLLVDEGTTQESGSKSDLEIALEIADARRDCAVIYNKTTSNYTEAEKTLLKKEISQSDTFLAEEEKKKLGKFVLPFYGNTLKQGNSSFSAGVAYILAYLRNVNRGNAEWLAIAGSDRGAIPATDLSCDKISETALDNMQSRENGDIAINPIMDMNPWGIRIWGNRTALENDQDLVASSFANIRILICDIKKRLYRVARQYQFEQNTDVLWVNFQAGVNSLLEEMKHSSGIAGYRWIKEQTSERAKLCAILRIIPIEPVEDFDLTLELTDQLEVAE